MKQQMLAIACAVTSLISFGQRAAADQAADAATASGNLEEIVVTAERRAQDLQQVAVPIDVVSGNAIESHGIVEANDLNKLVPGLAISLNGGYPQLYLRGLGTFGNVTNDSSVLPSLDGVPLATGAALQGAFYDLQRVEVLKGPQGTLYGLSSAAGAVNVISNIPTHTFGGTVDIDGGNYNYFKFDGAVNLPASDVLAFRVATQIVNRSGYLSDGGDDDHHQSLRLSALYSPSDALSVLLVADGTHIDSRLGTFVCLPLAEPADPWLGPATAQCNARLAPYAVPQLTPDDIDRSDSWGLHAEINWDLGFGTLTVLPAYRKVETNEIYEPGFLLQAATRTEQSSIEARLASKGDGPNNWLVGAYYFRGAQDLLSDRVTTDDLVPGNPSTLPEQFDFDLDTKTYAAFATDTFSVTNNFRVIAGVRYTDIKRDAVGAEVLPAPAALGGSTSDSNVTGKVGVEWDVAPRSLLYATVANAERPGGINADSAPNTYAPEKLTAYTVGSKNVLFDGRLRVNAELYYWNDKDHQENELAERNIGGLTILTKNIDKVEIKGIDLDMEYYVTPDDVLTLSVERNDARIVHWVYTAPLPFYAVAPTTGCVTTPGAITNFGFPFGVAPAANVNCSGLPLTRAPDWAGTASVQHTVHLSNAGSLVGEVDVQAASRSYLATDFLPQEVQAAYAVLNASFTYHLPGDRWTVALWGRNLTDKVVYGTTFERPAIGAPAPDLFFAQIGAPRTFGASLRLKF
jgi:iron complex outermembrane receptor protein